MPTLRTIEEAAPLLRCSTVTARRLIHRGDLPCVRVGKKYLISDDHIALYLKRNALNIPKEVAAV